MSNARNLSKLKPSSSGLIEIDDVDSSVTQKFGFRNRIINGAMMIDQRNAGASVTVIGGYSLDRWNMQSSAASKYSVQQNAGSVTPPTGFNKYLGVTSLSAYTVGATEQYGMYQAIEGFNIADLGWGTASASSVTLSFWVRSSLTGTFGGSLRNSATTRSYPFSYTINSSNTWEQKSISIVGDTSGTWATDNSTGIYLTFGCGVGSTYSGTAGSWAGTNYISATGATSVVGTNGATFYITGVQLEKGLTATPFEYRPYGQELELCRRYYEREAVNPGYGVIISKDWVNTVSRLIKFNTYKRVEPTTTVAIDNLDNAAAGNGSVTYSNTSSFVHTIGVNNSGFLYNNIKIAYIANAEL